MSGDGEQIVVDSSVVAKWLIPEGDSPQALKLRARHKFVVPDILFAEIANILWKQVARGALGPADVEDALAALQHFKPRILPSQSLLADACRLALALNHPAYDCFYLLAAARLGTVLVTADERLLRKLAANHAMEWSALAVGLSEAAQLWPYIKSYSMNPVRRAT
ncbi:MAG TPA: type II toxin-antitoxin system VapC family toxin [Rhizobiaceae bacterium]|nr:type II toxin-antitoxin system VapC family toxin [Rhizobiaceae bacterium]